MAGFQRATGEQVLVFHEKPGCISNRRQKAVLRQAGFALDVRNLLTTLWDAATLARYFEGLPVAEWFNRSAPRIQSGEIDPDRLDAAQVLAAMIEDPLLIRRPLIACGEWRQAGFDLKALMAGLSWPSVPVAPGYGDLESCARGSGHQVCPEPGVGEEETLS